MTATWRLVNGRVIGEDGAQMAQAALTDLKKFVLTNESKIAAGALDFGRLRGTFICLLLREPRA